MIPAFRDHAANERTFLAWVRTAISVVGFGLAIGRLGGAPAPAPWSAAVMTAGGASIVIIAYVRMRHLRTRIDAPETETEGRALSDALLIAMVLTLCVTLVAFAFQVNGTP